MSFTLGQLTAIAAGVVGVARLELKPDGSAKAVPGWDSLNHTLITFGINEACGTELEPGETAACATFAELVALVNQRMG